MVQKQLSYKYQVYNELKKGILTGQYPPGSVMNERKLSEEMGISRTPIREGLQMLARDGWLQMETYKGAVVREFDPHYMWELIRIRYALELSAVEDAVRNMTDEGLRRLRQIQENQREDLLNYNVDEFIRHDREFHSCIYEMSLNRELMNALFYPQHRNLAGERLDFAKLKEITFEEPPVDVLKGLPYAYKAGRIGGSMPTVLNAANEKAVALFLDRKIQFLDIYDIIEDTMNAHKVIENPTLEEVLETEQWVYEHIESR